MSRSNPYLLPEDGIIDNVAIARAISGEGIPVMLTPTERSIAIRGIVQAGGGCMEVAASLGTSSGHAARLIRQLGYRIVRTSANVSIILGSAA